MHHCFLYFTLRLWSGNQNTPVKRLPKPNDRNYYPGTALSFIPTSPSQAALESVTVLSLSIKRTSGNHFPRQLSYCTLAGTFFVVCNTEHIVGQRVNSSNTKCVRRRWKLELSWRVKRKYSKNNSTLDQREILVDQKEGHSFEFYWKINK